jgi:methylmalonyl-CoA mutase N-terminal domain/subunit
VNQFADAEEAAAPAFRPDPAVERERATMLAAWRSQREPKACAMALAALDRAARGRINLMPPILEALKARATLGEVCDTLREVFGTYRPGAKNA